LAPASKDNGGSGGFNLQQMVGMVCYMRFLITFIFSDVSVTLKNPKHLPGIMSNIF
jgi:hypothetical protein